MGLRKIVNRRQPGNINRTSPGDRPMPPLSPFLVDASSSAGLSKRRRPAWQSAIYSGHGHECGVAEFVRIRRLAVNSARSLTTSATAKCLIHDRERYNPPPDPASPAAEEVNSHGLPFATAGARTFGVRAVLCHRLVDRPDSPNAGRANRRSVANPATNGGRQPPGAGGTSLRDTANPGRTYRRARPPLAAGQGIRHETEL